MTRPRNDQGVSVIIGTLLLILITVTAAAALALMVSQMQKAEMNRQTQIAAVHDEDIVISGMSLTNNGTLWSSTYPNPPFNINNSQNWSSVSFNLMNLNTQAASVMGIAINNQYASNITFTSLSGSYPEGYCNFTVGGGGCNITSSPGLYSFSPYLTIPAGQSQKITIDLTSDPVPIGTGNQIDIKVLTSLTNIFEQTFTLPTPVISYQVDTIPLGNNLQQHLLVLDGSGSSSGNASIVSWNWTIMNATSIYPSGNCSDINDLSGINVPSYQPINSKIYRFTPLINGPFCANLTVTDSNGMIATSPYQLIPADSDFTQPANIFATFNSSSNLISVTLKDINGNPVPGAAVNYIVDINQFGNLSLSTYADTTDPSGNSNTTVNSGIGSVKVVSGDLSPVEVAVAVNETS